MKKRRLLATGVFAGLLVGCGPPQANNDPAPVQKPQEPAFEAKVAAVGDGSKGRSLENEKGEGNMISQPAVTLFRTKEKIAFEIGVPHALDLFNASEGRNPKSHEEFMEKIIKFNNLILPELPKGRVYRYHPDDNKLWVEPETPATEKPSAEK